MQLTYNLETDIDFEDDDISLPDSHAASDIYYRPKNPIFSSRSDAAKRQIEPQQNWFAKLFNVKPAFKVICFTVSSRRARREIVSILKDWKRYGIKDLQVDKMGNRVFGKVAAKNCQLPQRGLSYAANIEQSLI